MSDHIRKSKSKKSSKSSNDRRIALLAAILSSAVEMPSCSNCEKRGINSCQVSEKDSSRCAECVRSGRSRCDVQGPSNEELIKIGEQFRKLEEEVEQAEAKVQRLRAQKKLWFEKMMRAVRRGISSVEELEKVEKEEAEREASRQAENRPPSSDSRVLDDFNWDVSFPDVPLSGDVASWMPTWPETSATAAGSSQGESLVPMCFPSRRIPST
jgi:hypothetical protein